MTVKITRFDITQTDAVIRMLRGDVSSDVEVQWRTAYKMSASMGDEVQILTELQLRFTKTLNSAQGEHDDGEVDAEVTVQYQVTAQHFEDDDLNAVLRAVWPYLRAGAISQSRLVGLGSMADNLPIDPYQDA